MNSSSHITPNLLYATLYVVTVCGSVATCLTAVLMVLAFRLYRRVVYRLALYQVLASLALAAVEVFQIVIYAQSLHSGTVCTIIGYLTVYAQWMKLLFTAWVTLHIFCFGVFRRTLKLEPLYVVTTLLVPAVVSSVPVLTDTYGTLFIEGKGTFCYIFGNETKDDVAIIERFVLWDVPALLTLLAASAAMLFMVCRLMNIARLCRLKYSPLEEGQQFRKALQQMLPLAAFPMLFFVFTIPQLALNVFLATNPTANGGLFIGATMCVTLWSLASGLTLVIHICVVKCFPAVRRKLRKNAAETLPLQLGT